MLGQDEFTQLGLGGWTLTDEDWIMLMNMEGAVVCVFMGGSGELYMPTRFISCLFYYVVLCFFINLTSATSTVPSLISH